MPYKVTPDKVVDRMKILIYGPQGAGKTYLAATAQDPSGYAGRPLFKY